MGKLNISLEELRKLYVDKKLTSVEIGKLYNVADSYIRRKLRENGWTRKKGTAKKGKIYKDFYFLQSHINEILLMYQKELIIIRKIATHYKVHSKQILNVLKINNIPIISKKERLRLKNKELHEKVIDFYLKGNSMLQTSKEFKVGNGTVEKILSDHNVVRKENRFRLGITYKEYLEKLPLLKRYKNSVEKFTLKVNIKNLPNFDKRGNPKFKKDAYHLDHRYSIKEGFNNNINPKIISNINNLEFIPASENCSKHTICSISLEELLDKIKITNPELLENIYWR